MRFHSDEEGVREMTSLPLYITVKGYVRSVNEYRASKKEINFSIDVYDYLEERSARVEVIVEGDIAYDLSRVGIEGLYFFAKATLHGPRYMISRIDVGDGCFSLTAGPGPNYVTCVPFSRIFSLNIFLKKAKELTNETRN